MSLGVIATINVKEGKNEEFEALFTKLTEQVLANEPGCTFYALHRSKSDPQVYKVLEQYQTADDIKAHGVTDYFQAAGAAMAGLVTAAPDIEVLDGI